MQRRRRRSRVSPVLQRRGLKRPPPARKKEKLKWRELLRVGKRRGRGFHCTPPFYTFCPSLPFPAIPSITAQDRFEPLPFVFCSLSGFPDDLFCSPVSLLARLQCSVDGDVLARRALRLGPHRLRRVEVLAELLQRRLPLLASNNDVVRR